METKKKTTIKTNKDAYEYIAGPEDAYEDEEDDKGQDGGNREETDDKPQALRTLSMNAEEG